MTGLMRKHGKVILAILGSFLMIVFILPNFGRNTDTNAAGYLRGRLNGKKIYNRDINAHLGVIPILQRIDPYNFYSLSVELQLSNVEDYQPVQWFLLLTEADKLGLTASEAEITQRVADLHATQAELESVLQQRHITPRGLRLAFHDEIVLKKLVSVTLSAIPLSLPEIEYEANLKFNKIQFQYATLDAAKGWEKAPDPTPQQIQKQFDLYKNTLPAPSRDDVERDARLPQTPPVIDGHTYPFGYEYPDRVKIEYLRFDNAQLASQFKQTPADFDAAFDYYNSHPDEFKNPAETGFVVSTRPAVKPFAEVQKDLVRKQVEKRVSDLLKKAGERALTLAGEPFKNDKTTGGFLDPIAPSLWANYQTIRSKLQANSDFKDLQIDYAATGWLDASQIARLPNIGNAFLVTASRPISITDLATHVKELVGEDKTSSFARYFLEVGPDGPLLANPAGDVIVYRVIAADKSHAPASVDEVRPQVVQDLKKIHTYQQLQTQGRQLATQAASSDLLEIARAQNLTAGVTSDPINRLTPDVPGLGNVPGLVDAAFDLIPKPPSTQPATQATTNPSPRFLHPPATTMYPQDPALKIYVLSVIKVFPATGADFASARSNVIDQLRQQHLRDFLTSWFSLDALAARLKYVPEPGQEFSKKPEE